MKRWIALTDEYRRSLKDMSYRKIRTQEGDELRCLWIEREQCFYHNPSDTGFYMDEPEMRPTHVLVG